MVLGKQEERYRSWRGRLPLQSFLFMRTDVPFKVVRWRLLLTFARSEVKGGRGKV